MIITTSWDDGDILDERVAEMLDRQGLTGTFYIARNHRPKRLSEAGIRMLAARFEVGAHTLNHPDLTTLAPASQKSEIAGSKAWLEDITGKPVTMFCYPCGRFDRKTKQAVRQAGFRGARTIRQFSVTPPRDHFALRTTLQVHPNVLRRNTLRDLGHYLIHGALGAAFPAALWAKSLHGRNNWSRMADLLLAAAAAGEGGVFHLWGHSWEIEEKAMWRECDAFLRSISGLGFRPRSNAEIC
jgi:peptidoglycan/xylan/chitin deacetylase (PgdA/CDA1 family)